MAARMHPDGGLLGGRLRGGHGRISRGVRCGRYSFHDTTVSASVPDDLQRLLAESLDKQANHVVLEADQVGRKSQNYRHGSSGWGAVRSSPVNPSVYVVAGAVMAHGFTRS